MTFVGVKREFHNTIILFDVCKSKKNKFHKAIILFDVCKSKKQIPQSDVLFDIMQCTVQDICRRKKQILQCNHTF